MAMRLAVAGAGHAAAARLAHRTRPQALAHGAVLSAGGGGPAGAGGAAARCSAVAAVAGGVAAAGGTGLRRAGHGGVQKRADGRLTMAARWLLAPYLGAAWINSRVWTRRAPQPVPVMDGVWLGRIPSTALLPPLRGVVDVCAELSCRAPGAAYARVPMLDLVCRQRRDLAAVQWSCHRCRRCGGDRAQRTAVDRPA
ncbi:hypothetical protein G6F50_014321 [Rhizopus delemar]|uniref:Uncharacterized protein n=1 Tax=Rhizopus delemar TaxID=936053 RepID=A0A9P7C827_9FUNG|nr:hypothetical protein G6F50_014321 [Rhizopus delemar]